MIVQNQRHDLREANSAEDVRNLAERARLRRQQFFKGVEKPVFVRPTPPPVTFDELVAAAYPKRYPDEIHFFRITPTVAEIQRAVCRHFKVDLTEVLSCRRYMGIVMPRQIAMALCKKLTARSFPDIGRRFGGKDHTTVLHSWRKLQPAVLAAIEKVGTSATLNELVGMTAYYADTMTLEIPYKKNRQQPSLAKIDL